MANFAVPRNAKSYNFAVNSRQNFEISGKILEFRAKKFWNFAGKLWDFATEFWDFAVISYEL